MQTPEQLAAALYDLSVLDWDGEIDFYRELAHEARARKHAERVLKVGCGTGRVTLRLVRVGFEERAVYGDFFKNSLEENSSEMIWLAGNEAL